ncbi:MAG: aldo/keto reductase [Tatlockia sp.]|nr:aldo/keto reductase [Tatlockia sp.]
MQYNYLGKSGLQISELSLGSWLTFGNQLGIDNARQCMRYAFEQGINFFDNAEVYAQGESEKIMGQVLKDFKREDIVVSTKIFWGGEKSNAIGLSRKHLIEGTKNSLERLQLDYVDLLYCHRPDPNTPIEETVRAMDYLINSGKAFYWGTSEWSAEQIVSAHEAAKAMNCIPPTMEQPEYNLFHRHRVELEYKPLYDRYGLGTTIWSPLASGLLTGKYNKEIPADSRLGKEPQWRSQDMNERIEKVKNLVPIARALNCTLAQLALAWCLTNPKVSSVIVGASSLNQLRENLKAIDLKKQLTPDLIATIESFTKI